jgi:predicted nucleic acid-binding protein
MSLAISPESSTTLKMTLLLQTLESGRILASVLELPDCRVESATKEEAIATLNAMVADRLKNADIVSLELPIPFAPSSQSPWAKLFGLFKDDPDFAEIAATLRAERESDDDSEVDPSVYLRESVEYLKNLPILNFDDDADRYHQQLLLANSALRKNRLQKDMRIAAIALSLNATVITRNQRDFSLVPGLQIADWTNC